jgi:hypothetical protein
MSTQAELVTVIQTEAGRRLQYLAALPQDAWAHPSACPLWDVRDVVVHSLRVPGGWSRTYWLRIMFRALSRSVCMGSISRSSALETGFQDLVQPC